MRRSNGPWLTLPALLLSVGSMSVASAYLARDVAGRDTFSFSTISPKHERPDPTIIGIMDLSDDDKELVDDGPLALEDSPGSLRRTTIIGGWALPWGFYHGEPNTGDHFPLQAGPKAPWIHKEWRGLPAGEASVGGHAELDHNLPSPEAKPTAESPEIELPLVHPGSIHIDHFTVSQVVPTPEPTIGLTVIGLGWLMMRRK